MGTYTIPFSLKDFLFFSMTGGEEIHNRLKNIGGTIRIPNGSKINNPV